MAENESLELGGAYAKRWDIPFASVRNSASCGIVSNKVEDALITGLRKALKQLEEYGVSLSDLLAKQNAPKALGELIRKTLGHDYVRLFADTAAAASGSSADECLRRWIDAILEKIFDQICHRVAGNEHWPTFYDVHEFMSEVRQSLEPAVNRIVTNFVRNPESRPRRVKPSDASPVNPTTNLLGMSLLGSRKP